MDSRDPPFQVIQAVETRLACEKVGFPAAAIPRSTSLRDSDHGSRRHTGGDGNENLWPQDAGVFDRYNIVDGKDMKDAGKKLAEFLKGQA